MFINIVSNGKDDIHSRWECKHYSAMTDKKDLHCMLFFLYGDNRQVCDEMQVDKTIHTVYVESNNGKTVDTYKWKIDKDNKAIRY